MSPKIKNKINEMMKTLKFILDNEAGKLIYDDDLDKISVKIFLNSSLYTFTKEEFDSYEDDDYDEDINDDEDIDDNYDEDDEDEYIIPNMKDSIKEIITWIDLPKEAIKFVDKNNNEINYNALTIEDIRNEWNCNIAYNYTRPIYKMKRSVRVNGIKKRIQDKYGIPFDSIRICYPSGNRAKYISNLDTLRTMWSEIKHT